MIDQAGAHLDVIVLPKVRTPGDVEMTPSFSPSLSWLSNYEIFTPSLQEFRRATALLAALSESLVGASAHRGEMIDEASRKIAERVVRAYVAAGSAVDQDSQADGPSAMRGRAAHQLRAAGCCPARLAPPPAVGARLGMSATG